MELIRSFDIGGSHIVSADVTADGRIHNRVTVDTPIQSFVEFTDALEPLCPKDDSPISVAIAGVIQPATGIITSANIPCVSGRSLAQALSARLSREVVLINDANAFALAETHFGKAKGHEVVLAIILGSGIGGGIVINGQIVSGSNGAAGEWGHGPIVHSKHRWQLPDVTCLCGQKNCLDNYAGAIGLRKLFTRIDGRELSTEQIVQAWLANDAAATETINCWLDIVGSALANIVNFIDPSIVVVGGGLSNSNELIDALDTEVQQRTLAVHRQPLLYGATHGPEQGLLGAALQLLK